MSDIAEPTGLTVPCLTRIRNYDQSRRVHVRVAHAISAAYDQMCMTVGPSARTTALATKQLWRAPLDWDDIDDPNEAPDADTSPQGDVEEPDENAVDALMTRRVRWNDVAVSDRRWAVSVPLAHLSNIELGRSLGVDSETVRRARRNYAEAQQKSASCLFDSEVREGVC